MQNGVLPAGAYWLGLRYPARGSGQRQLLEIRCLRFTVVFIDGEKDSFLEFRLKNIDM